MLKWSVKARKAPEYTLALFLNEHDARQYARDRNAGRRVWIVVKIEDPSNG